MNVLHLLTLVATLWADAARAFALPSLPQHHSLKPASVAAQLAFVNARHQLPGADGHWLRGSRSAAGQQATDGGPFQHDDRSVYDPGAENIPLPAFIAASDVDVDEPAHLFDANNADDTNVDSDGGDADGQQAVLLKQLRAHIKEDEDMAAKAALLLKLLESSADGEPMPLVYVEDEPDEAPEPMYSAVDNGIAVQPDKRSGRYYRRYPWKRQNTRYRTYEIDQRYLCVPNRNEILKLLIGLDEGRKGNNGHTVNFCNRKRPAKAIFSNIRFLG